MYLREPFERVYIATETEPVVCNHLHLFRFYQGYFTRILVIAFLMMENIFQCTCIYSFNFM